MMIEMQGTIENSGKPLSDEVLGSLSWRRDDNEALLLVGHHLLEGKVSELEKPFLVVRPTPGEDIHTKQRTMTIDAVIKRRLVFKNRPKPLVTQLSSPS
ncbi:Ctf8 [Necator americanus]|uniref:Ctf8 n=1 Tax=Necator americanus TaxID=51031 RepID=W2TJP3_NECAM|nr:Ctf8 [Necator americanus]ETN82023.1 Ctf8 [Necator americanus]